MRDISDVNNHARAYFKDGASLSIRVMKHPQPDFHCQCIPLAHGSTFLKCFSVAARAHARTLHVLACEEKNPLSQRFLKYTSVTTATAPSSAPVMRMPAELPNSGISNA